VPVLTKLVKKHMRKTYFFLMPKTGGNKILHSLDDKRIEIIGHDNLALRKDTLYQLEKNNSMSFTTVRNPVNRLVSAYEWVKSGGTKNEIDLRAQSELNKFRDFKDFVSNIEDFLTNDFSIHFFPMHYWIYDSDKNKFLINYFLKYEHLESDFKKFCNNHKIKYSWDEKKRHAGPWSKNSYGDYYNAKTLDKVKQVYDLDFKLFSYQPVIVRPASEQRNMDNSKNRHENTSSPEKFT
jgi:hypothetical protein